MPKLPPLSAFTNVERRHCLPAIKRLIRLANIARTEGVLALEQEAHKLDAAFLKKGLLLIIDGTDPEIVEKILHTYIMAEQSNARLLQYYIETEGVLMIQQGQNPAIIDTMLRAMLGLDFEEQANAFLGYGLGFNGGDTLDISALPQGAGNDWLNAAMQKMFDRDLQRILAETDNYTLCVALQGMPRYAQARIFANISVRLGTQILQDAHMMKASQQSIDEALDKICEIVRSLSPRFS